MSPPTVLIAGGGPAGVEVALALHHWAGDRLGITVLSPDDRFVMPPFSVAEPFVPVPAVSRPLRSMLAPTGATLRHGSLAEVRRAEQSVSTGGGQTIAYDRLVIAVGAHAQPYLRPPAVTFRGSQDAVSVRVLVEEVAAAALSGAQPRIVFVVPPGPVWPLPAYELAMATAWHLEIAGARSEASIALVTSEPRALSLFGTTVSDAVAGDLAEVGIELRAGAVVSASGDRTLGAGDADLDTDRVVALPTVHGPEIPGLPADPAGFVTADRDGRVRGSDAEFVAGDARAFPIKQGGVACQQGDAVAAAVCRDLGIDCPPHAFEPVLRGMLWSGRRRRAMRAEPVGGRDELDGVTSLTDELWSPETKIAGLFLSDALTETPQGELVDRAPYRS